MMRFINAALLALSLSLSACGGGTTAGVGGSGIGGTGITTASVTGNVVQVTASILELQPAGVRAQMLAALAELISKAANAQSAGVVGIKVFGGGGSSITDQFGRFNLPNVTPSNNFTLTLVLPSNQQITLGVGNVPAGTIVNVRDIVINTSSSNATPGQIEVEDDPSKDDGDSQDDVSADNSGSGSSGDDGDSLDDVSEDNSGSGSGSSGSG